MGCLMACAIVGGEPRSSADFFGLEGGTISESAYNSNALTLYSFRLQATTDVRPDLRHVTPGGSSHVAARSLLRAFGGTFSANREVSISG
jgi:hypothetical protein